MPTYEYECEACTHNFDEFQGITDPPLKKCPKCGKRRLRRVIGAGGAVIFRGSGFYQTDYRSESYKKAAKADSDSSKSSSAGSSDSTSAKSGDSKSTATKESS